ncbi:FAD-dependent oxidoreductase [Candidatus Woesearchaeota archaeon]|nr:FAD-dependent oxidoreductase [Candidatus Woesearchaeota archaeon]
MEHDIVIIGGGPAGITSALTAKQHNKEKRVLVIKGEAEGVIPCGIPYMFHALGRCEDNEMSTAALEKNGIDTVTDEAIKIDLASHRVDLKQSGEARYGKLILATGSTPILPPIKGVGLPGVHAIHKEMGYLKQLKEAVLRATNIIIIGGGFIGVELADEIARHEGKRVTIIELERQLLPNSFDEEFSKRAEEQLLRTGVQLRLGVKAEEIIGEEEAREVILSTQERLPADLIILGIGAKPNAALAQEAGLLLGATGGVAVDDYLHTSDKDVLAVGDCAEKKDFFTGKPSRVMLASTATAEARIAGANLYAVTRLRQHKGTIAAYSTMIGNVTLGSAGLTEQAARNKGFDVVTGEAAAPDKHPGKLPGTSELRVKLVFHKESGVLLGGQVAGEAAAGEAINTIAVAIQQGMSASDIETLQVATHPKLTPAPTVYPLIVAAQAADKP